MELGEELIERLRITITGAEYFKISYVRDIEPDYDACKEILNIPTAIYDGY